jgi:hypothetical protein
LNNSLIDLANQVKLGRRVRGQLTQTAVKFLPPTWSPTTVMKLSGQWLNPGARSVTVCLRFVFVSQIAAEDNGIRAFA